MEQQSNNTVSDGILATVTDSFDLKDHGRTDGNGRRYVIDYVKKIQQNPLFQERLRLKELYGYFGHFVREITGKAQPAEQEVVMVKGKPVVITAEPSNVMTAFDVSDSGIVTHTQEFFDNNAGRAAYALWKAGKGGWSWAASSAPSAMGHIASFVHGFDYVLHPSYINKQRMQLAMESTGFNDESLLAALVLENAGFDNGHAVYELLERRSAMPKQYGIELLNQEAECAMLQSQLDGKNAEIELLKQTMASRNNKMLLALESLPIQLSERQRAAFAFETDADQDAVRSVFESVAEFKNRVQQLPGGDGYTASVTSMPVPKDSGALSKLFRFVS